MKINVLVKLAEGDNFLYDAVGAANQVIAALGGDVSKDYCVTTIVPPVDAGVAGAPPPDA